MMVVLVDINFLNTTVATTISKSDTSEPFPVNSETIEKMNCIVMLIRTHSVHSPTKHVLDLNSFFYKKPEYLFVFVYSLD